MKKEKSCGCIIIENNKVLLIHQTKGHWGFPKGHIEENETEFDTALREVKEETNLDVEINIEKRYTEKYITDTGVEKEVVLFIAKKVGGEIKAQESEVKNIKWIPIEEVVQKITYPTTKKLFQKVLKDMNIKNY